MSDGWTKWSDARPEDHTVPYRWRVSERPILGLPLRPEWTEKLVCCGMGHADNEWWPPFSHWDGYRRTVDVSLEWRAAQPGEDTVFWGGLDLLPNPFTGSSPVVEYHGQWIGAPPYKPEWLSIKSWLAGANHWRDAGEMQRAWNRRTPDPATIRREVLEEALAAVSAQRDSKPDWSDEACQEMRAYDPVDTARAAAAVMLLNSEEAIRSLIETPDTGGRG